MKFKKAIIDHHPIVLFIIAFILGLVAAYLWINYLPDFWNPYC